MNNAVTLLSSLVVILIIASVANAQTPSLESMIEQLKTKPENAVAPRTRSLRNLAVNVATSQEVAAERVSQPSAERASLSLQIQFDFNSATVKPESKGALFNLANAMLSRDLMENKFLIEGHSDAKGKQDYNQRLSQQRADSVREILIGKGVDGTRLSATGKGSSDPANTGDPQAAENRRVKIVNLQ
jgi:OmpA-OmpF porin, OOP family